MIKLTRAQPGQQYLSSSFSADGKWITFGMSRGTGKDDRADVYVMRVNGTGVRAVTKSPLWDSAPDWGLAHSRPAPSRRQAIHRGRFGTLECSV